MVRGLLKFEPGAVATELAADGAKSSDDARDVSVKRRVFLPVRNAEYGCGRVRANPGKSERAFQLAGENAAMFGGDLLRGPVQIPRTRVIAEPRPETKHFVLRG